eukprot:5653411-Amphidinium_carterae.2
MNNLPKPICVYWGFGSSELIDALRAADRLFKLLRLTASQVLTLIPPCIAQLKAAYPVSEKEIQFKSCCHSL